MLDGNFLLCQGCRAKPADSSGTVAVKSKGRQDSGAPLVVTAQYSASKPCWGYAKRSQIVSYICPQVWMGINVGIGKLCDLSLTSLTDPGQRRCCPVCRETNSKGICTLSYTLAPAVLTVFFCLL